MVQWIYGQLSHKNVCIMGSYERNLNRHRERT